MEHQELVCPKCSGQLKVRHGCKNCGNANVEQDNLLHHYVCAYVGQSSDFGTPPICPKCRKSVTPADFEQLKGPFACNKCGWQDAEMEFVATCAKCTFVFPLNQAREKNVA